MTRWKRLGKYTVAGLARSGCVFDPDAPVHQETDAVRFAEWIQAARDDKDYEAASRHRTTALSFRMVVRQGRDWTFAIDGPIEPDWSIVPSYRGYAEWAELGEENGRHVLETCWHPSFTMRPDPHSIRVANWKDHPNLQAVRELGLPDVLWTHPGQSAMESMTSTDWFFQQTAAIDAALVARQVEAVLAELMTGDTP